MPPRTPAAGAARRPPPVRSARLRAQRRRHDPGRADAAGVHPGRARGRSSAAGRRPAAGPPHLRRLRPHAARSGPDAGPAGGGEPTCCAEATDAHLEPLGRDRELARSRPSATARRRARDPGRPARPAHREWRCRRACPDRSPRSRPPAPTRSCWSRSATMPTTRCAACARGAAGARSALTIADVRCPVTLRAGTGRSRLLRPPPLRVVHGVADDPARNRRAAEPRLDERVGRPRRPGRPSRGRAWRRRGTARRRPA